MSKPILSNPKKGVKISINTVKQSKWKLTALKISIPKGEALKGEWGKKFREKEIKKSNWNNKKNILVGVK